MGPMEIRDFATMVNKCRLVKECNRKLRITKSNALKKRVVPESQDSENTPLPRKQFHSNGYEGKQPQGPIVKQICPKCGRDHGSKPVWLGKMYTSNVESGGILLEIAHISIVTYPRATTSRKSLHFDH